MTTLGRPYEITIFVGQTVKYWQFHIIQSNIYIYIYIYIYVYNEDLMFFIYKELYNVEKNPVRN